MPQIIKETKVIGAESLLGLKDTPGSYVGQGGKVLMVDPSEQRLFFQNTFSPEGLLGSWQMGTVAGAPNSGEFSTNDLAPNAILNFRIHNTDQSGDKTDALHYLIPGDQLLISSVIGGRQSFFDIQNVVRTNPSLTEYTVTFQAGDNTPLVVGSQYNLYSSVLVKLEAPVVTFRALRSDPPGAQDGWVYFNEVTQKLRLYASGAWVDIN